MNTTNQDGYVAPRANQTAGTGTPATVQAVTGHHIHLELNTGWLHARFSCHEPPGTECRRSCTRGCEEITEHCRAEHEWENVDYCNLVTWLEESGIWDELYEGPKVSAHSGLIVTQWNGDGYTWSYAPDLLGLVDAR